MPIEQPFHDGEIRMQKRIGEEELARRNGRAVSDAIMKGALKFVENQKIAVFGSVDANANVWASALFGRPGFIIAPDPKQVNINPKQFVRHEADPLWKNTSAHPRIGMLLLESKTRRRLRINGRLRRSNQDDTFELIVEEAYPNCPKYIQKREIEMTLNAMHAAHDASQSGFDLTKSHARLIQAADTFYIASTHEERGVDASHRGGLPGFVEILDENRLRIPDYRGNSMYNTLGNLTLNPAAGLMFIDYENARTLHLTGRADIIFDHDDPSNQTGGTKRWWEFRIEKWIELRWPITFRTALLENSPHHPRTLPPLSIPE